MSDASTIELLFLGTGTSAGVPMIGCHCDVCSSTDPHDTRHRTSVVISYAGKNVLVDTPPELRITCVKNRVDLIDSIVFTHAHADHIMGLDDVRRFNTTGGGVPIDAWADVPTHESIDRCFGYAFRAPPPEMRVYRPQLVRKVIEGPFDILAKTWTPIPLLHGRQTVLGFRIDDIAYCTDVSDIPEPTYDLLRGLDLLVLDALRWTKHSTHFTVEQAIAAARRIGAKRTLLTHMAHDLGHELTNAKLPPDIQLAYDGQRVLSTGR